MAATTTASEQTARTEQSHAHIDPAARLTGYDVPVQTRSERPRSYDPADFGAPTGREVNWKHTPMNRIGALLDADAGDPDAVTVTVSGAPVGTLAIGQAPRGTAFEPEDLTAAIAWVKATQARHVVVEGEADEPIVIGVVGNGGVAHEHIVIEALPNAQATVVLRHSGSVALAENVEIIVGEGAHLKLVTVQEWQDDAIHLSAHQARVGKDATLRHFIVSFGGGVVRVNPNVRLAGAGSHADVYGIGFCDAGQHLENQVYVFHEGTSTSADVLYKSALQGVGAHTVWIGDVLIGPDAFGTDSYEANRNLVLTEGAHADSIPNLEIEIGDIIGAGHASATGRFDDEQLFYLQARGIDEAEARRLVVLGFLSELVQRLRLPELEAELIADIERELGEEPQA
ncbi:Fe-S cluster assembly protein SufD [Microbacterium protaetiae]|uniref:Fe-S cluster assembly protein SufD n=1 Tax=Microbacterium protaetiae TaxID=2509458 RepID=A0A4P6EGF8_9MICO|nr:Fe-S cluster assembly protein SufD [Microbacterium protaetiae]QAY61530.1 Fe-S cluster assembly protein SufD [Microbacterium protaetiae]